MKLHITLKSTPPPHTDSKGIVHGWGPQPQDVFDYDDETGGSSLTPAELERLVRLWLMAATDSPGITQGVIDELTAKLKRQNDSLKAAVEAAIQEG